MQPGDCIEGASEGKFGDEYGEEDAFVLTQERRMIGSYVFMV